MSEEEMTKEKCEAKGGTWNAEDSTCTMPPAAAEEKAAKTIRHLQQKIDSLEKALAEATQKPTFTMEKPKIDYSGLAEDGLMYRQLKATEEYYDKWFAWWEQHMDMKMKAWEDKKAAEASEVFDRAMGIRENQPLTRESIPHIVKSVRKAMLEETENQRSPAATAKAAPDGNTQKDPFNEMLKPFTEAKKQ